MGKNHLKHSRFSPQPADRIEAAKAKAARLASQGGVDDAIELLSAELLQAPTRTDLLLAIARILLFADRLSEAAETLAVLRRHTPTNAEVAKLLGIVFGRMRQYRLSIGELLAAHEISPHDPDILHKLAQSYEKNGNIEEAVRRILEAVARSPKDADLICSAAFLLHHAGKLDDCRNLLLQDREIAKLPEIRLLEAMLMPMVNRSVEEILEVRAHYRETLLSLAAEGSPIPNPEQRILTTNFLLGYHGLADRDLIELSSKTILKLCPDLAYVSPELDRPPTEGRLIKVGFVSSNLGEHSVGRVLNRFLAELDRNRFHVTLFELPGKFDSGQDQPRKFADKTVALPIDLAGCRLAIERETPDILVFPDFVLEPRSDLLAYGRLAPVQCATWGHPGTSGRPSLDYWISCEDWEPPGNEALYTETLIRLSAPPMIATKLAVPAHLADRSTLGIPEGRIYGCAQSLYKLHPDFDSILAEILRRDREGHVVVIGGVAPEWIKRFRDRFDRRFADVSDRLIVLNHLNLDDYLSLLSHCSVALDPTDFGGANTSLEAFTIGLPVVTWPGRQLRSRQTFSLYRMMDFPDLVVDSREAYIDLALKIAQDPRYRSTLSSAILDRLGAIFDTVEITRELEGFFKSALNSKLKVAKAACSAKAPRSGQTKKKNAPHQ